MRRTRVPAFRLHDAHGAVSLPVLVVLVTLLALVVVGCSGPRLPGRGPAARPLAPLAAGTCWSANLLGSETATIKAAAKKADIDVAAARVVMANRPAFDEQENCAGNHRLEVYRVVDLPGLKPQLTSYAALLRTDQPLYGEIGRAVQRACMLPLLAQAAARTGLRDVTMVPVLPAGMDVSWAPPSPRQWAAGQRVFGCVFSQAAAGRARYAEVFTRAFPTASRTCILSTRLLFVDCARKHDRERIAVLQARQAVVTGAFPGRKGIRNGPRGRYLAASAKRYAALDTACTTYLRSISTTRKLTGIAEIDLDYWPAKDGSYPIVCEADTRPNEPPLITKRSVYNRP